MVEMDVDSNTQRDHMFAELCDLSSESAFRGLLIYSKCRCFPLKPNHHDKCFDTIRATRENTDACFPYLVEVDDILWCLYFRASPQLCCDRNFLMWVRLRRPVPRCA